MLYIGVDLGTSAVKLLLMDENGNIHKIVSREYPLYFPHPGWSEQKPGDWFAQSMEGIRELTAECDKSQVRGISFGGQMHGLVLTGDDGYPVRPAIIWLDQRAGRQLEQISAVLPEEEMGRTFCNRVSSGFAFPSLLWVKENEPDAFARAAHVLSPKDYLRYKMTGEIGAEVVDASSTTMFDTAKRDWAWDVLERFGLPARLFPEVKESADIAGTISPSCAAKTGLPAGIPVIYGSGDQPAQSIGNGVIKSGQIICNIGTGGQISAFSE